MVWCSSRMFCLSGGLCAKHAIDVCDVPCPFFTKSTETVSLDKQTLYFNIQ